MEKALVLVGPSGVGKTTVANCVIEKTGRFLLARSVTTRPPRNDQFNDEYIYLQKDDFLKMSKEDGLLEYMEYGDNFYGTPISEIERIFSMGKTPLLILDIEGAKNLRKKQLPFLPVIIYLWDDLDTIEKRLYSRYLSVPSEDKFFAFLKRKNNNINDYLSLSVNYELFCSFVKNVDINDSAEAVVDVFDSYSYGLISDLSAIKEIADSLQLMARQKLNIN